MKPQKLLEEKQFYFFFKSKQFTKLLVKSKTLTVGNDHVGTQFFHLFSSFAFPPLHIVCSAKSLKRIIAIYQSKVLFNMFIDHIHVLNCLPYSIFGFLKCYIKIPFLESSFHFSIVDIVIELIFWGKAGLGFLKHCLLGFLL